MIRKPVHVAMYSGGASSVYVAYHMLKTYGRENSLLFFANTLWEHEDSYRFMHEVADYLDMEITYRVDGRTPEQVIYDYEFIGNSRLVKCADELKVRQIIIFLEELRDEHDLEPILYFGTGSQEQQMVENLKEFFADFLFEPVETRFPLISTIREEIDIKQIIEKEWGIKLPIMYKLGFSHTNCGGRCVRGGFQYYAQLFQTWPEIYREQERMEEEFRGNFNKNISILKRDEGPLTLREYRDELERNGLQRYLSFDDNTVPCVCK
nr:phosphoadenosine phosphosulfate reductase family protein [Paenibacillus xylanexedens]